jgi:hypothetical protein
MAVAAQLLAAPGSAGSTLATGRVWYVAASGQEVGSGTLASPFRTIQRAINAARDGDTVVVLEGHYTGAGNVNLEFLGKAITVQSRAPQDEACVSATVLDAQGQGLIARFVQDEGLGTVLRGFTLLPGDRSAAVRGLPGFFEFSSQARPTTGELRVLGQAQRPPAQTPPAPSSRAAGGRVWEEFNPFHQPAVTTEYYGSGDADGDGCLSTTDMERAEEMRAGITAPNFRADVDGSGKVDAADVSLIAAAVHGEPEGPLLEGPERLQALRGAVLPAWWNRLADPEQRNAWVDRFLALDRTNEHPYEPWYPCGCFARQLFLHGVDYRGDLYTTFHGGGQRSFNIPLYVVTVGSSDYGHSINAILVGENPLSFDDWRFVEPQTDQDVRPGMWDMPYGTTADIQTTDWVYGGGATGRVVVGFAVTQSGWSVDYYHRDLVLTRPAPPSSPPDNRLDCWRPKILPGQPSHILFEQNRDDLSRWSDIFVADLPFTLRPTGTPLGLAELEYSHLLDAVQGADGTVHLLWTGQPAYTPGVFYSELDWTSRAVAHTAQLAPGVREPLMGRVLVTPQGNVHVFWFEQNAYVDHPYDAGIYWTTWTGSSWQEAQNITPNIPGFVTRLAAARDSHEPITYLFDAATDSSGEIMVAYTAYMSAAVPNENPVYVRKYDGQWGTPTVVGTPPIQAYGLDLSCGADDILHLLYWFGPLPWEPRGARGNLYHMMWDGDSWSVPTTLDPGGLAGYPRSATDAAGRLYAVWERETADSVVPVWAEYSEEGWSQPEALDVRSGAEAWYPAVDILPDGQALVSWSSRSPDDVAIETEYRWLPPPAGRAFLPLVTRQVAGSR